MPVSGSGESARGAERVPPGGPAVVRRVPAEATRALRLRVLRPGGTLADCVWPGDDDPGAVHLAAFRAGVRVGVASLLPEAPGLRRLSGAAAGPPPGPEHAGRLRGVAVETDARRTGVGRALVQAALEVARAGGVHPVWCNARTEARSFWEACGFAAIGEVFQVAGIGPHVRMVHRSGQAPGEGLGLEGPAAPPS